MRGCGLARPQWSLDAKAAFAARVAAANELRVAQGLEPLPAKAYRKLRYKEMTREEQKAYVAEWRARGNEGRERFRVEWGRLCRLGLVPGWPNRRGFVGRNKLEDVVVRARREIAWMKGLDEQFERYRGEHPEAEIPVSNSDRFRTLTDKSMDVFDKILSADIPMEDGNEKLIREQREAAAVTIRIGARVAIELYRGQQIGALEALLTRMKQIDVAVDEAPTDGGVDPNGSIIEGEAEVLE